MLNDSTGWSTIEAHTGKRSLEIINIGGADAYWQGEPIVFNTSTQAFSATVWTKAKEVKIKKEKYQLAFNVFVKGLMKRVYVNILASKTDWQKIPQKFIFV